MKTILVIGGNGFVGRNVKFDTEGFNLISLDNSILNPTNIKYKNVITADICTKEASEIIEKLEPDAVILLAGVQFATPVQNKKDRQHLFSKNKEIAENLLSICKSVPSIKRVIYISTDMVYGKQSSALVTEKTTPNPIGEYGASKLAAEEILSQLGDRVAILRPRLIVGPGRSGTLALLAKFIRSGLPVPIFGNGTNRYQMISVYDLWRAIQILIEKEMSGVYNIGSDNPPTLNQLLKAAIVRIEKKNKIFRIPTRIGESILALLDNVNLSPLAPEQYRIASQNCVLDTKKLKASGWMPTETDEDILVKTLSHLV